MCRLDSSSYCPCASSSGQAGLATPSPLLYASSYPEQPVVRTNRHHRLSHGWTTFRPIFFGCVSVQLARAQHPLRSSELSRLHRPPRKQRWAHSSCPTTPLHPWPIHQLLHPVWLHPLGGNRCPRHFRWSRFLRLCFQTAILVLSTLMMPRLRSGERGPRLASHPRLDHRRCCARKPPKPLSFQTTTRCPRWLQMALG